MEQTNNVQRGQAPMNVTSEQKQWNPQAQPQSQHNSTPMQNPNQGWPGYQNSPMLNQWQRYQNNSLSSWYPQQQYSSMPSPSWNQRNQSYQHPQSNPNWNGMPYASSTQSNPNLARWNNNFQPPPQYQSGGMSRMRNEDSWTTGQNANWDRMPNMSPANHPNNFRGQQGYMSGYMSGPRPVANWWNQPHATNNNNNWAGNMAQYTRSSASGTNVHPSNWRHATPYGNGNNWFHNGQNNWQGSNTDMHWQNPQRNGLSQSRSGTTVPPVASNATAAENVSNPSNGSANS